MASNLQVFSFERSGGEMARINAFTPGDAEALPFFSMAQPKGQTMILNLYKNTFEFRNLACAINKLSFRAMSL